MDFTDLTRLTGGYAESRAIQAAVSLGVFDALAAGGRDAPSVAASIHSDSRATEILLDALAAIGLLRKDGKSFSLTEISETYLAQSSPRFLGGMVFFDSSLWDAWGRLEQTVRTGKPPRPPDMFQNRAEETQRFISAMDSLVKARGDAEYLAENLDFSGVNDLLDVGSGPGTYPIQFCRRHPKLRATIFDLPATLKVSERCVAASGIQERIRMVAGDYRADPLPAGFQIVFLSNIIHGESAQTNERLMARLYDSLDPGGRILIKDHIQDESLTYPPAGAVFALLMLLTTEQGRCYSFHEVRQWLERAGFTRVSQTPLPSPPFTSSLVIGEKA